MAQYHLSEFLQQRFPDLGTLEVTDQELNRLEKPDLAGTFLLGLIVNQHFLSKRRQGLSQELASFSASLPQLQERYSYLTSEDNVAEGVVDPTEQREIAQRLKATRSAISQAVLEDSKFEGVFASLGNLRKALTNSGEIPIAEELFATFAGVQRKLPDSLDSSKTPLDQTTATNSGSEPNQAEKSPRSQDDFDVARLLVIGIIAAVINNDHINAGLPIKKIPAVRLDNVAGADVSGVKIERIVPFLNWQEFFGEKAQIHEKVLEGFKDTVEYFVKSDQERFKDCVEPTSGKINHFKAMGIIYCFTRSDLDKLLVDPKIPQEHRELYIRRICSLIYRVGKGEYYNQRKFKVVSQKVIEEEHGNKEIADIIESNFQSDPQPNPDDKPVKKEPVNKTEKDAAYWVRKALKHASERSGNDPSQQLNDGTLYRESQISVMDGGLNKTYVSNCSQNGIFEPSDTSTTEGVVVNVYSAMEVLFMMVYKKLPQRYKNSTNRKIFKEYFHREAKMALLEMKKKKETQQPNSN